MMGEQYRVIWEIDIEANSPRQAAEDAYATMLDANSTATFFTVTGEDGEPRNIDLGTIACIFCRGDAGNDYHLLEDGRTSCDGCWDERLRS